MQWWDNIDWDMIGILIPVYFLPMGIGGYLGFQANAWTGAFMGFGIAGLLLAALGLLVIAEDGDWAGGMVTYFVIAVGVGIVAVIGHLSYGYHGLIIAGGGATAFVPLAAILFAAFDGEHEDFEPDWDEDDETHVLEMIDEYNQVYLCIAGSHTFRAQEVAEQFSSLLGDHEVNESPYPSTQEEDSIHSHKGIVYWFWSSVGHNTILIAVLEGEFDEAEWQRWGQVSTGVTLLMPLAESYNHRDGYSIEYRNKFLRNWYRLTGQDWFQSLLEQKCVAVQTLEPEEILRVEQIQAQQIQLDPDLSNIPTYRSHWSSPSSFMVALMSLIAQTKQNGTQQPDNVHDDEWDDELEQAMFDV